MPPMPEPGWLDAITVHRAALLGMAERGLTVARIAAVLQLAPGGESAVSSAM